MVSDWDGKAEPFQIHREGLALIITIVAIIALACWWFGTVA